MRCRCAQPKGHHRQESRARARGGLKCNIYIYMYMYIHTHIVCFEGEKKAQIFLPPAAGETPDPCHLSGPEMISNTFRHDTPSDTKHLRLPGAAAGAMDVGRPRLPEARSSTDARGWCGAYSGGRHALGCVQCMGSCTLPRGSRKCAPGRSVRNTVPCAHGTTRANPGRYESWRRRRTKPRCVAHTTASCPERLTC